MHLEGAATALPQEQPASPLASMVAPLAAAFDGVNREAETLGAAAQAAQMAGDRMSPGDMITLSLRCNEFLFHCELTSNIASRSSDGVQELFKEQD